MAKSWLTTGRSSGFGHVLAAAVLARGYRLTATARDVDALGDLAERYPETARMIALDVTREGSAAAALALTKEAFGGWTYSFTMPASLSWARSRRRRRQSIDRCSKPTLSAISRPRFTGAAG